MMIRLIQAQVHISTVLSVLSLLSVFSLPALAAENGWQRGSCLTGSGVYRWEGGDRYEGSFQDNKIHGEGTYYLPTVTVIWVPGWMAKDMAPVCTTSPSAIVRP